MELSETFLDHFSDITDPRVDNHNKRHELMDIITITILGTICGANGWNELYDFACAKQDWLATFLSLPNGIPSHDTFSRVFSLLAPAEFEKAFLSWIKTLRIELKGQVIAIDGKTVRGSHNRSQDKKPIHLVSAWVSDCHVMLAQIKTEEKSNEIKAIPRLLKMIDVRGSIVTIDAMGCQQKIATDILRQEADYILSLKDNQPTLFDAVKGVFSTATESEKKYKKMLHLCKVEKIKDHGRIERRRYTLLSAREGLTFAARWPGMKSIGMLEIKRTVNHETTHSVRFFVTSLHYDKIDDFMRGVRKHWDIEINLHWSLDVSFNEDDSRIRKGYSSENMAMIRRIALTLLKKEETNPRGITCKRKRAGWDHEYLIKVLEGGKELRQMNSKFTN